MSKIVSDLDLQALVDGELGQEEEASILEAIRQNPLYKARFEQLKAQNDLIQCALRETAGAMTVQ